MATCDTVLTNRQFFTECLDPAFPGLFGIDTLPEKEAEALFGRFIRNFLKPDTYFGEGWDRRFSEEEWETMPPRKGFDAEPRNFCLDHSTLSDNISKPGETTLQVARRYMKGHVVSCWIEHDFGGEIQWCHNAAGNYGEWVWQLNRHHEWEILGYCYAHSGDESFAKSFRDNILSYIRQNPYPGEVSGGATFGWRTIEMGIRCTHGWPNAIHACLHSPSISDRDWVVIFKSVYENSIRLRRHPSGGNWLYMEMAGLAHNGILYPFFKEAADWEDFSVGQLIGQSRSQLYDDGFHFELSTNYHQVVLDNVLVVAQLYEKVGKTAPAELMEIVKRMYEIYPRLVTPEGNIPNLNDGERFAMRDILPPAAKMFPERSDFLYLATDGKEGTPPDFTSVSLPYTGMAVFRSGWTKNDLWCFFEDAAAGAGHQHEDKLNVLLYDYGHEMVVEAGRNAYNGTPLHEYALCTQGHNGILVDGQGQARRMHYRHDLEKLHDRSEMVFRDEKDFACAEGVYDEMFRPDVTGIVHKRRVIYVKAPDYADPFILVIDRMLSDGNEHDYKCLWHYADVPCETAGVGAKLTFPDGVTLTTLTSGYTDAKIVRGQTEPEWQGWIAQIDVNLHTPTPCLELTRTAGDFRAVTVLAPAKNDCRLLGVTAGDSPEDTALILHTAGGDVAVDERDFF